MINLFMEISQSVVLSILFIWPLLVSSCKLRLSGEFSVLGLGILIVLVGVVVISAIPLTFGMQPSTAASLNFPANISANGISTNQSDFQNQSESKSKGASEGCSSSIGIAPEEGSHNNSDIQCLENVFERCQPFDGSLGYVLGSLRFSIKGVTNGDCYLNLAYEIERGQKNMSCMVPLDKMSAWRNWKRGDGFDAVDDIAKYCTK